MGREGILYPGSELSWHTWNTGYCHSPGQQAGQNGLLLLGFQCTILSPIPDCYVLLTHFKKQNYHQAWLQKAFPSLSLTGKPSADFVFL